MSCLAARDARSKSRSVRKRRCRDYRLEPMAWTEIPLYRGHDLAVPIGIEQDVLTLPRAIEDYLAGRMSGCQPISAPVVRPDPQIAAEQVMQTWTTDVPEEEVTPVQAPSQSIERADTSVLSISRFCRDRTEGISDRDWQTYLSALGKGYDFLGRHFQRGSRDRARSRPASDFTSERRALHRMTKKKRE